MPRGEDFVGKFGKKRHFMGSEMRQKNAIFSCSLDQIHSLLNTSKDF